MTPELEAILRCPATQSPLRREGGALVAADGARYPIVHGVPVMLAPSESETL